MTRGDSAALLMVCIGLSIGCADSHEKVMREGISAMDQLATTLQSIETVEDAKAASGKVQQIAASMKSMRERLDVLGEPDAKKLDDLQERYGQEMVDAEGRFLSTLMRLMGKPELMMEVQKSLKEVKDNPLPFH